VSAWNPAGDSILTHPHTPRTSCAPVLGPSISMARSHAHTPRHVANRRSSCYSTGCKSSEAMLLVPLKVAILVALRILLPSQLQQPREEYDLRRT
jgi:hypothetical protein